MVDITNLIGNDNVSIVKEVNYCNNVKQKLFNFSVLSYLPADVVYPVRFFMAFAEGKIAEIIN